MMTKKILRQVEYDKAAYNLAIEYLLSFESVGISRNLLSEYLEPMVDDLRPNSLPEVYFRLLGTAQNRSMGPSVIGKSIGGIEKLTRVLYDFDSKKVNGEFGDDWAKVLDEIEFQLQPSGKIRRTPRSLWPLFCRSITSSARFLCQFHDSSEFLNWVDVFDSDIKSRLALPLLLSAEIEGIGFPLACDFLKGMGYFNFGKPDVHIKTIFSGLDLVLQQVDDYSVFKAISRVAESNSVTVYNVDKLFWLIGSGNFHENPELGSDGRIQTNRDEFIQKASSELSIKFGAA